MLLISTSTKEKAIELLNKHFYSTTYNINENNEIVWKNGEIKPDLNLIISKNRFKIYQIKS